MTSQPPLNLLISLTPEEEEENGLAADPWDEPIQHVLKKMHKLTALLPDAPMPAMLGPGEDIEAALPDAREACLIALGKLELAFRKSGMMDIKASRELEVHKKVESLCSVDKLTIEEVSNARKEVQKLSLELKDVQEQKEKNQQFVLFIFRLNNLPEYRYIRELARQLEICNKQEALNQAAQPRKDMDSEVIDLIVDFNGSDASMFSD
ncbi:hypothetical protein C8F01DRAFT_1087952 [Mycena amicta]|nr:hypothetical protein C8F01DRAFT_1087952 [Mycena amicta]